MTTTCIFVGLGCCLCFTLGMLYGEREERKSMRSFLEQMLEESND